MKKENESVGFVKMIFVVFCVMIVISGVLIVYREKLKSNDNMEEEKIFCNKYNGTVWYGIIGVSNSCEFVNDKNELIRCLMITTEEHGTTWYGTCPERREKE